MAWKPLVEGELATAALAKARELALDIAREARSPMDRTLFWAYASTAFDEPFASDALDAAIQDLVAHLTRGVAHPMLYNDGLCGVGWALAHVVEGDSEELLVQIDAMLEKILATSGAAWRGPHDLSQGLAGYAVYCLERARSGESTPARQNLVRIVELLAATAVESPDGSYWRTAPELLPDHIRRQFPDGRIDLGLAHGQAGVIGVLGRLDVSGAAELKAAATRFLVAQRQPPTEIGSRFPALIAPGVPYEPGRAAWCYGDLGAAFALWNVAPELARETALDCASRRGAHVGVVDTALCHGSGGMAHLYNRLYQASGDERFGEAARNWVELTLLAEQATHLKGGRGLVDGSAGTALALIAASTGTEPAWDRLLLMDVV